MNSSFQRKCSFTGRGQAASVAWSTWCQSIDIVAFSSADCAASADILELFGVRAQGCYSLLARCFNLIRWEVKIRSCNGKCCSECASLRGNTSNSVVNRSVVNIRSNVFLAYWSNFLSESLSNCHIVWCLLLKQLKRITYSSLSYC